LYDKGFIEAENGTYGFGFEKGGDGFVQWSVIPLRLTASGHEYIESISDPQIWATLKSKFKNGSIETWQIAAKELLEIGIKVAIKHGISA